MGGKWLSLIKELAPKVEDVGVIFNPDLGNNSRSFLWSIEDAAGSLAIKSIVTPHAERADIEHTIIELGNSSHAGLVFLPDALTYAHLNAIVNLIAQHRIPAIYPWRDFVVAGGLISYGPGTACGDESIIQAAGYVHRILNGENPGELPVQAPTNLGLVINARTAKTLGLEIPARLIALADEVIEYWAAVQDSGFGTKRTSRLRRIMPAIRRSRPTAQMRGRRIPSSSTRTDRPAPARSRGTRTDADARRIHHKRLRTRSG